MNNNNLDDSPIKFIYPIPFNDFMRIRSAQKLDYTVKDYHQIFRLKKMLEATQKKISNRINLFKKASQKIIRNRNKENCQSPKFHSIKDNFNQTPITHHQNHQNHQVSQIHKNQSSNQLISQQNILETNKTIKAINVKFNNAKNIKIEKQKYKELIAQKRKDEMRRKLKSAQNIKKNRQIAKFNKLELERQKKQYYNKLIQQKVKREKQIYLQLQKNLEVLQIEQRQALIKWKQTVDYP